MATDEQHGGRRHAANVFVTMIRTPQGGYVMHKSPDIEVEFTFLGVRKHPTANGYRPHHQVLEGLLATGTHHYYEAETAPLLGTIKGTITFLAPAEYPHSLYIGKTITIQEGARVVGHAKILKILNPLLIQDKKNLKHHS